MKKWFVLKGVQGNFVAMPKGQKGLCFLSSTRLLFCCKNKKQYGKGDGTIMFGFFKRRKELKKSQKHHKERSKALEKRNSYRIPDPDDWINQVYHSRIYEVQGKIKRVLTKEERKKVYNDASRDVFDYVDKNLFSLK